VTVPCSNRGDCFVYADLTISTARRPDLGLGDSLGGEVDPHIPNTVQREEAPAPAASTRAKKSVGGSPTAAALFEFVLAFYGSASTSQSCGNGPKLNFPAWKTMSGSSSSGPLKKRTSLPTSAASGGPPPTIR
jgi:hypothetical protein